MTADRWKGTRDFLVRSNLLAAEADWRSAFTLDYVEKMHVTA